MNIDNVATEQPPLTELIESLEQAALMAKQLHGGGAAASNPELRRLIFASLDAAHSSLSSFLSLHSNPPGTSLSSTANGGDEPMMMTEDEDEEEQDSKDSSMEKVEERIRDCLYIQNKRPKRPLSPPYAAVLERRRLTVERECSRVPPLLEFDPQGSRLRRLDLVYQFHS